MKRSTMVNAWMRHDFEYFPRMSRVVDVPEVVRVATAAEDVTVISDMDDNGGGNDGGDDGNDGGDDGSGNNGGRGDGEVVYSHTVATSSQMHVN